MQLGSCCSFFQAPSTCLDFTSWEVYLCSSSPMSATSGSVSIGPVLCCVDDVDLVFQLGHDGAPAPVVLGPEIFQVTVEVLSKVKHAEAIPFHQTRKSNRFPCGRILSFPGG